MAERGKKQRNRKENGNEKRKQYRQKQNRTVADNVKLSNVYIHVILHIPCINLYSFQKRDFLPFSLTVHEIKNNIVLKRGGAPSARSVGFYYPIVR